MQDKVRQRCSCGSSMAWMMHNERDMGRERERKDKWVSLGLVCKPHVARVWRIPMMLVLPNQAQAQEMLRY